MAQRETYQKAFFILSQEDKGFSRGVEAPSGYIKTETAGGKGKLTGLIKNLKPDGKNTCYKAYIIKHTEHHIHPACIGRLSLKNDGSAELNEEFDPVNFYSTGRLIKEFNMAVVVAEHEGTPKKNVTFPLVGFSDDAARPDNWKQDLKKILLQENAEEPKPKTKILKDPKDLFNKCFERCNPFNTDRQDYMWWLAQGPFQLTSVLEPLGIFVPELSGERVKRAHFKYRHLIVGTYSGDTDHVDYVACGVPGTNNSDEKPFDEVGRWVPAERRGVPYGSFGYWLVYIDSETRKILGRQ